MTKKVTFVPKVSLNFVGGFLENEIDEIPEETGLYVVFVCRKSGDIYECKRIAYIGKAVKSKTSNLRERMRTHINDDFESWRRICEMADDEIFVYCYAICSDDCLEDVESALIYKNKPVVNVQSKDNYNGKSWHLNVVSCGDIGLLLPNIYVMRLLPGSR